MAASTSPVIELWNDIDNNKLVVGPVTNGKWDTTPVTLAARKIYQASQLSIRWNPIKPDGQFSFIKVPVSGITLDIAIGARAGVEAILARQNVWTAHADGYLYATLNLNTTDLNTAIGSNDALATYFEISMTENGNARPVYQELINITSVVIGPAGSSALPAAASQFYTKEQIDAIFVKFTGNPAGATIELPSPDSAHSRLIGCNNDGSAMDETA